MLPGEVTGCDGHPSAQRQRKMSKSLTGFLLQEIFREDFAEGGMTESRQEKAESWQKKAGASRRSGNKQKKWEKAGRSGSKQKNAGEAL